VSKTVEKGGFVTALYRVLGEAEHAWNGVARKRERMDMTNQRGPQLITTVEPAFFSMLA
jgi:hypothetical protein